MSSDHPPHAEQSRAFARRVIQGFDEARLTTDDAIEEAGGPSDSYMTALRHAANDGAWVPPPRRPTQQKIERAAGWESGSAWTVWNGGEPTLSSVGGAGQDAGYVSKADPTAGTATREQDDEVLRAVREMQAELRALSERVGRLEDS